VEGDYYILLGVRRTAKKTELQRAFRRLSRKYHPDINPGDRAAEVHYRRICEAFKVLSSPDERERYDRYGKQPDIEPETPEESYGFEGFDFTLSGNKDADIFPEIFRRLPRTDRSDPGGRGEDLRHTLSISFEESLQGVEAKFRINRLVSCGTCEGWGEVASDRQDTCQACEGSGRSTQSRGFMLFAKPCPECGGSGIWDRQPCPDCRGGRLPRAETVKITVPPGVDDGYRIVVAGKGNDGRGRGRTGDLHVQIHVAEHPRFTRKGDNLFCTIPITFTEAALGCRIEVPTVGGTVKVRVPAGIQSGQKLRLSERGAPTIRGDGRGDLFVIVQVVTPVVHDHRSREILTELAGLHPKNPREGQWPGEK
jgi:molecular chaperone DnaJ